MRFIYVTPPPPPKNDEIPKTVPTCQPERARTHGDEKHRRAVTRGRFTIHKLQAHKWALLEKDLDFVIISDVIGRRFLGRVSAWKLNQREAA